MTKKILGEDELGALEVETAEQQSEKRRVLPHLGLPAIRFYQADAAADAPGAWYAVVHRATGLDADVRLNATDAKALHAIAEQLAKGKLR